MIQILNNIVKIERERERERERGRERERERERGREREGEREKERAGDRETHTLKCENTQSPPDLLCHAIVFDISLVVI